MRRTRPTRCALAAVLAAVVIAAPACGSDDDSATTTAAPAGDATTTAAGTPPDGGDTTAYCEASLAIETDPGPEIDFATATPEEIGAAVTAYITDTMTPLFEAVKAVAPAELDEAVAAYGDAIAQVAETGDPSVFEDGTLDEAEDTVHTYDLANCGWATTDVATTDYAFGGLEESYAAGPTSFEVQNATDAEVHEVVVVRIADDVDLSVEELVQLPEEEAFSKIQLLGTAGPMPPGADDHLVVDLEPGRYGVVCFLPEGTESMEALETAEGRPHAHLGMVGEFTVN